MAVLCTDDCEHPQQFAVGLVLVRLVYLTCDMVRVPNSREKPMTTREWDNQFWEYLMGRREYPEFDHVSVAYPVNFTPLEVTQIEGEEVIEVTVK